MSLETALKSKDFNYAKSIIEDYSVDFFDTLLNNLYIIDKYNKWHIIRKLPYFQELKEAYAL